MTEAVNNFTHTDPYTIGVEEEYMICNPKTGELISKADEIMNSLSTLSNSSISKKSKKRSKKRSKKK